MYFRFLHLILADMHQKGIYAGGSVARLRPGSCKGDKRRDNIFVILIGESPLDIILQIIIL